MFSVFRRILSAAAIGGLLAAGPAAADEVAAIATGGQGDLTMCPYMGYMGCNLYHHIELPPQIAVGDKVSVRFGSNPKSYDFPIARIVRDGGKCTVFSQLKNTENVEKIVIAACQVPPPAE